MPILSFPQTHYLLNTLYRLVYTLPYFFLCIIFSKIYSPFTVFISFYLCAHLLAYLLERTVWGNRDCPHCWDPNIYHTGTKTSVCCKKGLTFFELQCTNIYRQSTPTKAREGKQHAHVTCMLGGGRTHAPWTTTHLWVPAQDVSCDQWQPPLKPVTPEQSPNPYFFRNPGSLQGTASIPQAPCKISNLPVLLGSNSQRGPLPQNIPSSGASIHVWFVLYWPHHVINT